MSSDGKVRIDVSLNTDKLDKEFEEIVEKMSNTEIEIKVLTDRKKALETVIKENLGFFNKPFVIKTPELKEQVNSNLSKMLNDYKELSKTLLIVKENHKELGAEARKMIESISSSSERLNQTSKITEEIGNSFEKTKGKINETSKSINEASRNITNFGNRIYSLLKSAFVFNVISRSFRGLSTLLSNLIKRDAQFVASLTLVKANLVRAFAPIWQAVLPWIRALGMGLLWLSNQMIRFINWVAGRQIIKPVNDLKEAQKVVSDFMKIASPTRAMFNFEKPSKSANKLQKNIKKTGDNAKKAQKSTNTLLASFDKLETLKFKDNGLSNDPFGLEELKKIDEMNPLELKANIKAENVDADVNIDEDSIETQISKAINAIEEPPLEFDVKDNIDEQVMSQVNGLNLPALDFKVDADEEKLGNIRNILAVISDILLSIGLALGVTGIIKSLSKIASLGLAAISPTGWLTLMSFLIIEITRHWDWFVAKFQTGWNWIINKVQSGWDWLMDKFRRGTDFLKKIMSSIFPWFSMESTSINISDTPLRRYINQSSPNSFEVPKLAQGAILRGGDPFLAYVNDQPMGQTNIETPLQTMIDAFKEAMNDNAYNQPRELNITATGNMSEFIRYLNLKLEDEKIRAGNNLVKMARNNI